MCRCGGFSPGGSGGGYVPPTVPVITPAWFRVGSYTFADFSSGSDSFDLNAYAIPIKGVVHGVIITPVTQFAGPLLESYAIQIGVVGDTARYQSPVDLLTVVPGNGVQVVSLPLLDQLDHVAATSLRIVAISQGTTLDAATAGAFYVDILISVTP